jgi:carbamoyltransferase
MAGGVALNCTANAVLRRSGLFDRLYIQPAAGDDGTALGAALYVQRRRAPSPSTVAPALPLFGPSFERCDILSALARYEDCEHRVFDSEDDLVRTVARALSEGQVIGWFQGRMEYGPRALGNRSILADPRDPDMRDRINGLVKKREGFRPFAPAVVAEHACTYFDIDDNSEPSFACMLMVAPVRDAYRGGLRAVTHVDGSARVQIVFKDSHPRFWKLLDEFGRQSGVPILLNTSFNVRGQPIVCTPDDAIKTFRSAGLDILVCNEILIERRA